jgi:hypothetical protein
MSEEETQAQELLTALKEQFPDISDNNLIKFLRWKQDVGRATERINVHRKWRQDNPFAFDATALKAAEDPMLQTLLEAEIIVAPDGMTDKQGHTVLVGRLRNNLMAEHGSEPTDIVRMAFYTIDRVLETNLAAQQNGVVIFHDLTGLGRKNLHPMIPKLSLSGLIGNFPIKIKGIYIYNAPWFFYAAFKVVSLMMPSKLRNRVHFLKKLEDAYEFIDQDQMLEEHGGQRQHDQIAWVAAHIARERCGEVESLSGLVSNATSQ